MATVSEELFLLLSYACRYITKLSLDPSMSLNRGKIRDFLFFKSQNFLIEKKFFVLRAKIFRAQLEKIFFLLL